MGTVRFTYLTVYDVYPFVHDQSLRSIKCFRSCLMIFWLTIWSL